MFCLLLGHHSLCTVNYLVGFSYFFHSLRNIMRIHINVLRRLKNNLSFRFFCSTIDGHPYDNVVPFESNKQLANHLCENVLYDNNGIIVVNKPYGISFSRDVPQWKNEEHKKKVNVIKHKIEEIQSVPKVSVEDDRINFHDALPYIKSNLNCDTLCVIRSPEKYTTGVCLFGRTEKIRNKVMKCWERSRSQKIALESYLAICSGVPIKSYINNLRVAVALDVSENGRSKKAILKKNYSRNDVLLSRVKVATVDSLLVSASNDIASVVQVMTNQRKWHFVRLFLASNLLSPAIGDHIFGSRVKKVMGTSVAVDQWSSVASLPQKLHPDLLKQLDLLPGSEKFIPTMIHLSEIKLIQFLKKSDLVLQAPPPPHFTWTIDKLGLYLPNNSLPLMKCEETLAASN